MPFIRKPIERLIEKIARRILKKDIKENVITLLDVYEKDTIAEVLINVVPEGLKNKKLLEINSRGLYNLNILLLKRNGVAQTATKETIIEENDIFIVFGPLQSIKKLFITTNANKSEE